MFNCWAANGDAAWASPVTRMPGLKHGLAQQAQKTIGAQKQSRECMCITGSQAMALMHSFPHSHPKRSLPVHPLTVSATEAGC